MKTFIKILKEFVAIQSISTDSQYKKEIAKAVKKLADFCLHNGLKTKILKSSENPVIVAKTPLIPELKTILIYGHYDVQPVENNDAFILKNKRDKLFGRGTADNKGQILIHLYSIINLLKEKKLGFNVIFLIEGNEETGSAHLKQVLQKKKKFLKADCILVSDSELGPKNKPGLEKSFRGAMNFEVKLEIGNEDLHSGLFGGVVPNATEELGKILGSLTEFTGKKSGFTPRTKKYEDRRTLQQTVEVTGFVSGYIGTGFKNIIPCKASAKINVRSLPDKNPKLLAKQVKKFILSKAPRYTKIKFIDGECAQGMEIDLENPFAERAKKILREVYDQKPIEKRGGGTLPVGAMFKDIFNIPQVMVPLADENCGAHSASEFISLQAIRKGLEFSTRFFSK